MRLNLKAFSLKAVDMLTCRFYVRLHVDNFLAVETTSKLVNRDGFFFQVFEHLIQPVASHFQLPNVWLLIHNLLKRLFGKCGPVV